MSSLTFYFSGGDVVWSGNRSKGLSEHDVLALIALYRDEAEAAWNARDTQAHEAAVELHGQLYRARLQARQWARAQSPNISQNRAA